jgi:hypothetical protein
MVGYSIHVQPLIGMIHHLGTKHPNMKQLFSHLNGVRSNRMPTKLEVDLASGAKGLRLSFSPDFVVVDSHYVSVLKDDELKALWTHAEAQPSVLDRLKEANAAKAPVSVRVHYRKACPISGAQGKLDKDILAKELAKFIVGSDQPFSIVEDDFLFNSYGIYAVTADWNSQAEQRFVPNLRTSLRLSMRGPWKSARYAAFFCQIALSYPLNDSQNVPGKLALISDA